ncbi:MAG: MFS transporter, partial [Propionibacteriaceae bacterium]
AGAIGWPATSGLIPQIIPPTELQQGNAILSFAAGLARIVGVVAGGAVTALVGGAWALLVSALCYLGCSFCAIALNPRQSESGSESGGMFADLRDGWGEFTKHQWLWVVVLQWSMLILFFNAVHAVIGPVIADEFLGGPKPWSLILTGEALGDVLGVLIALRWHPRRPILLGVLLTALTIWIPFLLLGLGAPLWTVIVAAVPMGAAFSLFDVLWMTMMQRVVPEESLSRVSSYDAMGSLMLGPIGLLIAGPAATYLGARPAMVICAIGLAVVGASALISRDIRTLEWREDDDAAQVAK